LWSAKGGSGPRKPGGYGTSKLKRDVIINGEGVSAIRKTGKQKNYNPMTGKGYGKVGGKINPVQKCH